MEPNDSDPAQKDANRPAKKQDTLFGPNIGIVNAGPGWTDSQHEKGSTDELTPDIVKSWVAKSKETSQPTTTLQALVNLKRPSLRLSPLAHSDESNPTAPDAHHHAHALEFGFDCDAPKCRICVYVVVTPEHRLAKKSEGNKPTRISVFETVVNGGFGRVLKLEEEGAVLELGQFENNGEGPQIGSVAEEVIGEGHAAEPSSVSADTPGSTRQQERDRKKRFTSFHFRKQHNQHNHSVSGPALAVVDAEVGTVNPDGTKADAKVDSDEDGVKVIIKLSALDEDGHGLASANEQSTYLVITRTGTAEGDDESKPRVVKVVKREATIGPHTFHLHEIYGLSSSSTPAAVPAATPSPTTTDTHTYPPVPTTVTVADEEASPECLVCLSSPREVVLLPCRHLVACRECAVNMVEFGAGGNIVHADASETTPNGEVVEPPAAAGASGDPVVNAATPAPPNQRNRKRKAKGWFCPMCRQPYTSLLRITTTPPSKEEEKDSDAENEKDDPAAHHEELPQLPAPAVTATQRLAGFTRPRFLRGISRNRAEQDLERGGLSGPIPIATA